MKQEAKVNDLTNNSPMFKHPPIWRIMAGCDGQKIDLAPTDPDGDRVQCRWATQDEAASAFTDRDLWPSLSLDRENCIVTYSGTMDAANTGVKPVSLMIEDFDSMGNVRSSIPIQFLAVVWTPDLTLRSLDPYPDWFGSEEDDHDDFSLSKRKKIIRGRRAEPAYCNAKPDFTGPTPADGEVLSFSGSLTLDLQAVSQLGSIANFSYQGPVGLICSAVDGTGSVQCSWTPSEDQTGPQQFCFTAADSAGILTERRCITLKLTSSVTNILEFAKATLSQSWSDYGCAGRGEFEPFSQTIGTHIDHIDQAFYRWKKCYQCATNYQPARVAPYNYNLASDSCASSLDDSRGLCECDRVLINLLKSQVQNKQHVHYSASLCTPAAIKQPIECCNFDKFRWEAFNPDTSSCCKDGVKQVGTC